MVLGTQRSAETLSVNARADRRMTVERRTLMRSPEQPGANEDREHTINEDPDTIEPDPADDEPLDEDDEDLKESSKLDGNAEEDDELASEEVDDSDLNLLVAMAELDAEAAEAYRIAAQNTDQVHLRTKLEEFRGDHLRHVATLNDLISDAGGPEVSTELDEESSAMTMLAATMGSMGVRAALLAMIANEQLTNTTYQAAAELPFEEDVARVIEEHLADEQRHLQWLTEQGERVRDDELEDEATANDDEI
jgi:rubrerythrin